jgi:molybdopterin molybdotransferase
MIGSVPLNDQRKIEVSLEEALGMAAADDVVAAEDIPPFPRSLVDGYAVRAKDTYGARETSPGLLIQTGDIRIGQETDKTVNDGQAIYLATGAMLPEGADAVLMQEYVRRTADNSQELEATKGLRVGENICFRGEDVKAGQVVLHQGRKIGPFDLGVLAALGIARVPVYVPPVIGLVSSGDEVVPPETVPPPGKIRDINTYTISGLLSGQGCRVRFAGIAGDSLEDIAAKLRALRECDIILLSGGSSKGQADFVTAAIGHLGGQILFHGLNIKPGKPTIFGTLWGKPVFGLPGHPVSCAMVVVRFVLPLVYRLNGIQSPTPFSVLRGVLATNVASSYGIEEYVRVTVEKDGKRAIVHPIFAKSSVISMLAKADGYIIIEEGKEGLEAGVEVEVHSFA